MKNNVSRNMVNVCVKICKDDNLKIAGSSPIIVWIILNIENYSSLPLL